MKRSGQLFVSLLLILVVSSCVNKIPFHMEVMVPGEIVTPFWMKNMILIDNSGRQPVNVGHSYARNFRIEKDTGFQTDALSTFLVESLGQQLKSGGTYDFVDVLNRNKWSFEKNRKIDYLYSAPLSNAQVRTFSQDTSMHVLLSLDALRVMTITHSLISSEIESRSTRDVWVGAVWRMYDLAEDTLMNTFQFSDSLFWFRNDPMGVIGDGKLPTFDQVIPEIATVVAEKFAKKIQYGWEPITRSYFYRGSIRMREAVEWVRLDSLEIAASLWQQEFNKAHFRTKYRAAMNMMLYYEVKGQPDIALQWAEKAAIWMEKCPIGNTYADLMELQRWRTLLQERRKVQEKLNIYFKKTPNQ